MVAKIKQAVRALGFGAGIFWRASPLWTSLLLAFAILAGLMPLFQIVATQRLIDTLDGSRLGALPAGVPSVSPSILLGPQLPWIVVLVGALILVNLVDAFSPLLAAHLNERVSQTQQTDLFRKALSLDLLAFETPSYYDHLERAHMFLSASLTETLENIRRFLAGLLGMISVIGVIAQVSKIAALILSLGTLPLIALTVWQTREVTQGSQQQTPRNRKAAYWRNLSTKRESAAEVRLFGLGDYLLRRWREAYEDLVQERFARRRRISRIDFFRIGTLGLLHGSVLVSIVASGARGAISAGTVVACLYALYQFKGMQEIFAFEVSQVGKLHIYLHDLLTFLEIPTRQGGDKPRASDAAPEIVFDKVSFTYPGAAEPALTGIDLRIRPGERLALAGENGAGKSTLAKLLLGLYSPTEGRILADGMDLATLDPQAWRKRCAAVFQDFMRYHLTAYENIGFGNVQRIEEEEEIWEAARRSGADAIIAVLPEGYGTLLGSGYTGAHDLSVGQWQKMAIARAYLRSAHLLVLDEPTAALDALAEQEVYRQFSAASEGRTVLLISHRLGSARLADRIVFLERGRVLQTGTHEELIAAGGIYAELYEKQAEWYREPAPTDTEEPHGDT